MTLRGIRIVKAIDHAGPLDGYLRHAINHRWLRNAGCLEDCRHHIDNMGELLPNFPFGVDAIGPMDHGPVSGAAKVTGDLLCKGERRVECDRPANRHMCVGIGPAPIIEVCKLFCIGFRDAIEILVPIPVTGLIALRARAVVAADIDDQRVVQFSQTINRVE